MTLASQQPLRIAFLTTSWPRNEQDISGRFLVNQVEQLRSTGVQVDVVAARSSVGKSTGYRDFGLASEGGIVANAKKRPWVLPLMLLSMVLTLRRVAKKADIVHANWLLTAPIAALAGKPFILTLHGSGSAGAFSDLQLAAKRPKFFRWLVKRAKIVIAVSDSLADAVRSFHQRVVVISHGVRISNKPRDQGMEKAILFAGRLSPEKGIDVLVRAIKGADSDSVLAGVKLIVAGDGPEKYWLTELKNVEQLGFVSQEELSRVFGKATMLVMPSRSEGFGVVALEAMAHGVPVIASNVGGLKNLIEHEHTGLLVAVDDVDSLCSSMERLFQDDRLCELLSLNGQDSARLKYSWPLVTEKMIDTYREALNNK